VYFFNVPYHLRCMCFFPSNEWAMVNVSIQFLVTRLSPFTISLFILLEFELHLGYYYLAICEAQISYRKSRVVCRDDMRNFSPTLLI
jgi:hypothetical protein